MRCLQNFKELVPFQMIPKNIPTISQHTLIPVLALPIKIRVKFTFIVEKLKVISKQCHIIIYIQQQWADIQ